MGRLINIHTHHPTGRHLEPQGVGIHPWDADKTSLDMSIFQDAELIGEIGLDYACTTDRKAQEELFCRQLAVAEERRLPVVIHCVKAFEPILKLLLKHKIERVVFHGFIGSVEQAAKAVENGYFLSYGFCTERSTKTIKALQTTPLSNLFAETDTTPRPIEEAYEMICKIKGCSHDELQVAIEQNYNRLFSINDK